jgi:hypothetical protein
MKKRYMARVEFLNRVTEQWQQREVPVYFMALHDNQANIIARSVAAKHGWRVVTVGLA